MSRRILVNIGIVLVLAGIAAVCFVTGKSYNVIAENVPYTEAGITYEPLEAVEISIDGGAPLYLLDGDRLVGTAIGSTHILIIHVLDENDKPTATHSVPFVMTDLKGSPRILNVPYMFSQVKK